MQLSMPMCKAYNDGHHLLSQCDGNYEVFDNLVISNVKIGYTCIYSQVFLTWSVANLVSQGSDHWITQ